METDVQFEGFEASELEAIRAIPSPQTEDISGYVHTPFERIDMDDPQRDELVIKVQEALDQKDPKIGQTRRSVLRHTTNAGVYGALAYGAFKLNQARTGLLSFLDNDPNAWRIIDNTAAQTELLGEKIPGTDANRTEREIIRENERLNLEYELAQHRIKNYELMIDIEKREKINNKYAKQFNEDAQDLYLFAKRQCALTADTLVHLEEMLGGYTPEAANKAIALKNKIYGAFGLTSNKKKQESFKKKYDTISKTIKNIQANKKHIRSLDEKFRDGEDQRPGYKPWDEFTKRRSQLERTYLTLREQEEELYDVSDLAFGDKAIAHYGKRIREIRNERKVIKKQIRENEAMIKQVTGKDITAKNQYDSTRQLVRTMINGSFAAVAVATGLAALYVKDKVQGWTGLTKDKAQLSQYKDLAKRQEQTLLSRRELLTGSLPYLNKENNNETR